MPEMLTLQDTAKIIGIAPRTLLLWLARRRFAPTAHKCGRQWRFQKDEIEKWLTDNAVKSVA